MKNNFPKIPFLISVVFLCLSILAFLFVYKKIQDQKNMSEKAQTEWQDEMTRRDAVRSLDNLIKSVSAERVSIESHFAQNSDIVPFLDTIEELAKKVSAKAEVTSVDISKDGSSTLLVGLTAKGTFESVYTFITLLENSPYELQFESIDMQNGQGNDTPSNNSSKAAQISEWSAVFQIRLLSFVQ